VKNWFQRFCFLKFNLYCYVQEAMMAAESSAQRADTLDEELGGGL
jgi:hypothetical protein